MASFCVCLSSSGITNIGQYTDFYKGCRFYKGVDSHDLIVCENECLNETEKNTLHAIKIKQWYKLEFSVFRLCGK